VLRCGGVVAGGGFGVDAFNACWAWTGYFQRGKYTFMVGIPNGVCVYAVRMRVYVLANPTPAYRHPLSSPIRANKHKQPSIDCLLGVETWKLGRSIDLGYWFDVRVVIKYQRE
jgi:hypothetical protein